MGINGYFIRYAKEYHGDEESEIKKVMERSSNKSETKRNGNIKDKNKSSKSLLVNS